MFILCFAMLYMIVGILIGIKVTGFFLAALFWVWFRLPLSICLFMLGTICFCSLILIPLGKACYKGGSYVIAP
ncbi:MAG: hypothetical protein MJ105_06590 [Lachnospiraceae bacterium]|nr:hypothetical protein [Lachnospiraceae bacterium]